MGNTLQSFLEQQELMYGSHAHLNAENLPNIMYELRPSDVWNQERRGAAPPQMKDANGALMFERYPEPGKQARPLLDFPALAGIEKIGTEEEWWWWEMIMRLEPHFKWQDGIMRMEYVGNRAQKTEKRFINELQMSCVRGREKFSMIAWRPSKNPYRNGPRDRVITALTQAQVAANSTRGSTPGVVDPQLPDTAANRIAIPPTLRQKLYGLDLAPQAIVQPQTAPADAILHPPQVTSGQRQQIQNATALHPPYVPGPCAQQIRPENVTGFASSQMLQPVRGPQMQPLVANRTPVQHASPINMRQIQLQANRTLSQSSTLQQTKPERTQGQTAMETQVQHHARVGLQQFQPQAKMQSPGMDIPPKYPFSTGLRETPIVAPGNDPIDTVDDDMKNGEDNEDELLCVPELQWPPNLNLENGEFGFDLATWNERAPLSPTGTLNEEDTSNPRELDASELDVSRELPPPLVNDDSNSALSDGDQDESNVLKEIMGDLLDTVTPHVSPFRMRTIDMVKRRENQRSL